MWCKYVRTLGQIQLSSLRQPPTRMAHIKQHAVDQHQRGLEDVKIPLVAEDRVLGQPVSRIESGGFDLEVLDGPIHGAREDDGTADVEREQRLVHFEVVDAVLAAAPEERRRERDEEEDHD